ncbi:unnamed protein product [Mytilus coruscus]|uniref:WSC domain-containing protein n=1 Tax=Mytilus coruscus TaxID=42192 RepID=A0A6J8CYS9_MYTCO|nr:unnamed protein product [Mytilus coruscus]
MFQCSYSALGHADYIGCFVDSDPIRKFPHVYGGTNILTLTIDFCILGCADDGFKYAGMQSRQWCHCGNDPFLDLARHPNVSDSECNTPCYGNWTQVCGADWRLSIYRIREVISVPTFQQYGTAFYGRAISSQPSKSEFIHSNGLKAKVDCAKACGDIIDYSMAAAPDSAFCGICEVRHITIASTYWCPECDEGLCTECHEHHSISKATRKHGGISIKNYRKLPTFIANIANFCTEHDMKFENYCPHHNKLCCPACISTNHKKLCRFAPTS